MSDCSIGPSDGEPDGWIDETEQDLRDLAAEWVARLELELRLDELSAAADPDDDPDVDGPNSEGAEPSEMDCGHEGQDPDQPDDAPGPASAGSGPPHRGGGGSGNLGPGDDGWSADGIEPQLHGFVTWLVPTFELWERIPPCWASHPGVIEELRVAHQLHEEAVAVTDPAAAGRVRADWQDYLGRVLDRLAAGPGGGCAQRGEHRTGRTWDRRESAEKRRAARQPAHNPSAPNQE